MHGKTSPVMHDGRTIYAGLSQPFEAGRYHSLIAEPDALPAQLEVSARTAEGEIMGVRHRTLSVEGVQFHPESILTPEGPQIMANFLAPHLAGATEPDMPQPLRSTLEQLLDQRLDLSESEAGELLVALTEPELAPAMAGALLAALAQQGSHRRMKCAASPARCAAWRAARRSPRARRSSISSAQAAMARAASISPPARHCSRQHAACAS